MIPETKETPTYEELQLKVTQLEFELANLKRLFFGQKRERFVPSLMPNQLELSGFDRKEEVVVKTEQIHYTRNKVSKKQPTPHSRQLLPANLPRKEIVIEPEEDTTGMKKIGEEITEELEYKKGSFYVKKYIRPKYARIETEGIVIGTLPTRPIEKGIAGPGLLAHLLISKYVDHLPLYRQQQQYSRQGVELSKSTLYGWVKSSTDLMIPVYEAQKQQVLGSEYLMADETPIRVLDPDKKGTTHQGYFWVYYDPVSPGVFFDYRRSRSRAGPNQVLKDFKGYLQSDGYSGYDQIASGPDVIGVGCMAHARRYFVESKESDSERSEWMLRFMQELYKVEQEARESELSYEHRYKLRQEKSVPVLQEIKSWLDGESLQVLPKSAIGKAIGYALNQWPRLEKYVTDGRLEIDNNLVENTIRPIALGRKNYLFAGSHEGAVRAAMIYTLTANAKLKHLDPHEYLCDVIERISDHPHKRIAELLACNWKPVNNK